MPTKRELMARFMLFFVLAVFFNTATRAGEPGPDAISLMALDGKKVTFGSLRAKVTVIQFWATWCKPCLEEMPFVEALWKRYRNDKGVAVLSVKVEFDDAEKNLSLTRETVGRYEIPALIDDQMKLTGFFQPGAKKPQPGDEAVTSLQLPLLAILDESNRIYRFYGFEQGISREEYLAKKAEIIELARRGKLPEQKKRTMSDVIPRALLLAEMGQAAQGEKMLLAEIEKKPEDTSLLLALGIVYKKMGKPEKAIETVRRVLEFDPDNADAMNFIGYQLALRGKKLDEAEALVRRALKARPEDWRCHDSLGWVLFKKGDFEKSRAELEKALEISPGEKAIHAHLGEVYAELGMTKKALDEYRKALKACEEESTRPKKIRLGR